MSTYVFGVYTTFLQLLYILQTITEHDRNTIGLIVRAVVVSFELKLHTP